VPNRELRTSIGMIRMLTEPWAVLKEWSIPVHGIHQDAKIVGGKLLQRLSARRGELRVERCCAGECARARGRVSTKACGRRSHSWYTASSHNRNVPHNCLALREADTFFFVGRCQNLCPTCMKNHACACEKKREGLGRYPAYQN
jgi:hypothetical protein